MATMLLAALIETWIVTFWQPDLGQSDLEWQRTIAKLFAFPLTVRVGQGSWFALEVLLVLIDLGRLRILSLQSPPFLGIQGYVTWSMQLRGAAFLVLLGFHLAAIGALIAGSILVRAASRRWRRKTLMPAVEDTSIAKNVNLITAQQAERASGTRVLWRLTALCNCNRLVWLGESPLKNGRILVCLWLIVIFSTSLWGNNLGLTLTTRGIGLKSTCSEKADVPEATSLGNGTLGSEPAYVVGDVVKTFAYPGTPVRMLIWSARLRGADLAIEKACQISVIRVEKSHDFLAQLQECSAALIIDPLPDNTTAEEINTLANQTLLWTTQGNLLMIGSVPLTELGLAVKLGVRPTLRSEQADTSLVLIETSTALSHNLRYSKLFVSAGEWSMTLTENSTSEVVASYSDAELEQTVPAAILSSVGNGHALTFGFDLLSTVVDSEGAEIGQVIANALANYATVHLSLTSGPIGIASPVSPNLEPLDLASPLFTEVSNVAQKFNEMGFTVLYSNLLYANSGGEFLGRLSLHGPLSLFVEIFSSHVMVSYEGEPVVSFPGGYCIPRFATPFFVSVCSIPRATLSWPPGWAPPQVPYYHLSPTEASRQDMGALYSVEHLLGVDQARTSYGLDGSGVTVAVVDSGFSRDFGLYPTPNGFHPYYEQFYSDLLTNRYYNHTVGLLSANEDPEGHGTGIVANLLAVAPGIELHMVPLGEITYQDAIAALDEVLRIAPDVLSCSWGFYVYTDATILAQLRELTRSGTIVVFAVGNGQFVVWPAMEQCVVAVGGAYLDSSGGLQASNFSASGDSLEEDYNQWNVYPPGRIVPDVCGIVGQEPYGVLIEMPTENASSRDLEYAINATDGTLPADGWWVASGTSSAAPQVAGLAALMKQMEPAMNTGVFKHIAMTTCTDVVTGHSASGDPAGNGFDTATGAGLINASRALWTCKLQVEYVSRTLPTGKSVHFSNFTGPHGLSYHIDTSGTSQYGFNFFGLLADRDGAVMTRQEGSSAALRVVGWFRQYDTFSQSLWPGRRHLYLYVLPVDGSKILACTELLGANDGTGWKYVEKTITGTSIPWGMVRIAIGRDDSWSADWQLTAEWAQVIVEPYEWTPRTIPSGKHYNFYGFASPLGIAFHIDTSGSSQYSYFFFAGADDALFYNYRYSGLVPQKLSISGWFRQDDYFEGGYEYLQPGCRYLNLYLLTPDAQWVLATCRLLEWYDGDGWVYRRIVIFTASLPIGWVLVAVGRYDDWATDWGLTAEWCNLQITTWF